MTSASGRYTTATKNAATSAVESTIRSSCSPGRSSRGSVARCRQISASRIASGTAARSSSNSLTG